MASCESLYDVLGVSNNVSPEEMKKRYHERLVKYSPDKLGHGADKEEIEKAMQLYLKLQEAWKILNDPEKKRRYDAELAAKSLRYESPSENAVDVSEMDYDSDEDVYFYHCRCGGDFEFRGPSVPTDITCNTCSLSLCVTANRGNGNT
ncbi:dnaJ homolog subfamily C member 24-like [Apostichopus japonicus]|uniref:dnaJ homolog subfamily C member 24-like n=1 Tax=Stichopus japonicus TaxID=307972 RepID=UPI003AB1542F